MEHRIINTLLKARALIQHGWTRNAPAGAEAESAPWAAWMEQNIAKAGYEIVESPVD